MTPRALLTTIGATALTFGAVVGGVATAPQASAQEEPTVDIADFVADVQAARAEAYEAFVAALADELGSDEQAVDAAIREALKQQVAEQLDAGEISEEEAAARTAVIDVTDAPLGLGGWGHVGGGHGGFRGGRGPGGGFPGGPIGDPRGRGDDDRGVFERPAGVEDDASTGGEAGSPSSPADEDDGSSVEAPEA